MRSGGGGATAYVEPGSARRRGASRSGIIGLFLLAAGVPVALGVYAEAHTPAGRPLAPLGFSGMLQMKAWLTTAALALVVVQLVTALWMWGRLPGASPAPGWATYLHRWSGSVPSH